jgi:CHASE2 domain-containing sensor protein
MSHMSSNDRSPGAPAGLDPELLELFDQAPLVATDDEAFVGVMLTRLRHARRRSLLARLITTLAIIVSGALLAPYVAQATLIIAGWVTLYSPLAGLCTALIAWRIARRRLN